MKKLSILCGVLLVFGLMAGPAAAVQYFLDVGQDGIDNGATVNIYNQSDIKIDLGIDGYACPPDDKLFGIQVYINFDSDLVQITDCEINEAGGCDLALSGCDEQTPDTDVWLLICSNFSYLPGSISTFVAATFTVDAIDPSTAPPNDTDMIMANDLTPQGYPQYFDGFTADCNLQNIYPDNAVVTLSQEPPPCECSVDGDATPQGHATETRTSQYTMIETGNCPEPPAVMWVDTCDIADIDSTGLLTIQPLIEAETCQVCAIDTANTDNQGTAVSCCLAIEIQPGETCAGEIYLGGDADFCAENCLDPTPVDDPPYNRPGRRGLALTCGDIVDFCACDNCSEENPTDLNWVVECTKDDVATIETTSACTARLTVDGTCVFQADLVDCTVTVADSNNNWEDSVAIQVGKIIVDIGETTVTPDTDSVNVEISLTNQDHTVRALDITIDECAQGEDNLVCTECFADPDRALGFTCTASEQPDGSCRLVLYSAVGVIAEGSGPIATVQYDVVDPDNCDPCVCLDATQVIAADQFGEDLCACTDTGEVCFNVCGDIFPQDCLNPAPDCKPCGDGEVDLFDILEAVDIILGVQTPTDCQIANGDVPNGMPPYCGNPSGDTNCETDDEITIFDLLVIIDMALGRPNCCDYCTTGAIY